jgi:hypothetical protein
MPVNTAALKTFAPAMRRQLLEAVGRKLDLLLNSQTPDTLSTYAKQIAELREQEAENREQLLERVAYTWFNRLCALRYLDARGWHPFGCKVLMPASEGESQPELLKLMRAGSLPLELKDQTNERHLHGLLDGQIHTAIAGIDPQGEVYRELILASCRFYHQLLPGLFEALDDASELLLPDDLLTDGSVAARFRQSIKDEDCIDVEILGWLYQFYISERKEEAMKSKRAISPEDIPAATQLFTPHWIVRYMVENSLGRLWLRSKPSSDLRAHMPYFVDGIDDSFDQAPLFQVATPEDIRLLDPACGSGHILAYAFDLLAKIYEEEGYQASEIPSKIVANNLHGIEICPRAAQLAQLTIACKAREYSRSTFRKPIQPQVTCLKNIPLEQSEVQAWMQATGVVLSPHELTQIHQFREHASICGTLIKPKLKDAEIELLRDKINQADCKSMPLAMRVQACLESIIEQAQKLGQRYNLVIANPPYMGGKGCNPTLKEFTREEYPDFKTDSFSAFVKRSETLCCEGGINGFMTPNVWMYISSHQSLRDQLLDDSILLSLVELPPGGFASATVQICAFTFENRRLPDYTSEFIQLPRSSSPDELDPLFREIILSRTSGGLYSRNKSSFGKIPGRPLSYWATERVLDIFDTFPRLGSMVDVKQGLATCNNSLFVRHWAEVSRERIGMGLRSSQEASDSGKKWFPYNKGAGYKKWFGNSNYIVNWENNGKDIHDYSGLPLNYQGAPVRAKKYYFKEGITYSLIAGSGFSARYVPWGSVFDVGGSMAFPQVGDPKSLLAYLCSRHATYFINTLNPTLNYQVGDVSNLPLRKEVLLSPSLQELSSKAIQLAKTDWDELEISMDFKSSPLLGANCKQLSLKQSVRSYQGICKDRLDAIQEADDKINKVLDDIYSVTGSKDIPREEDRLPVPSDDSSAWIQALLSYVVGCMMGRYCIDSPGLVLADSRDSQSSHLGAYEERVGRSITEARFKPDPDSIIPVLDGEWFEDDIVARTREFLEVTFPESSVTENLRFIEESLGKDLRKYFCSDFYKDHLQTYKKRPIYWMVQSPKKGFACLIYLHRYTKDTLNQVLNNYFRPYLQKLEARLAQLGLDQLNDSLPTRERTAARKEAEKITKDLKECQAWEQDALLPLAQQRIELDLDDGVKVNYLKLQDVLAPIPGLAAKED